MRTGRERRGVGRVAKQTPVASESHPQSLRDHGDTCHQLSGPVFCRYISLGQSCGHVLGSISGQMLGLCLAWLLWDHLIFGEAWKGNQNFCCARKLRVGTWGSSSWSQNTWQKELQPKDSGNTQKREILPVLFFTCNYYLMKISLK